MKSNTYQSEVVNMKELNHLFIEMTAKSCNQHCKQCYIDFPMYKKISDFIDIDIVKQALNDTTKEDIECIYLTGAEPMTHPDFNAILRFCLKRSNVCICTNASFINEKKARFLKKVEEESNNEIIFMLSLVHFDEIKNDNVRCRGAFRQVLNAVRCLIKYNFNPIFNITNFYNEPREVILKNFCEIFKNLGFDVNDSNFKINQYFDKYSSKNKNEEISQITNDNIFDCKNSR